MINFDTLVNCLCGIILLFFTGYFSYIIPNWLSSGISKRIITIRLLMICSILGIFVLFIYLFTYITNFFILIVANISAIFLVLIIVSLRLFITHILQSSNKTDIDSDSNSLQAPIINNTKEEASEIELYIDGEIIKISDIKIENFLSSTDEDYLELQEKLAHEKTNYPYKVYPNDFCPCGSGKKYKQCCGRKEYKIYLSND